MSDAWAALADAFVDGAYSSVKGRVRTYVLHQQLMTQLSPPPSTVLDVGGGAGHQSLPLARLGYDVTILDPSDAMLAKAEQRLLAEDERVRQRVTLIRAKGEQALDAVNGRTFDAVLCHGVLMYLPAPDDMVDALCRCASPSGLLSLMALNARTLAVLPALEHRWSDALAAFEATTERGVLGLPTRGDTVDELSDLLRRGGVDPLDWYGVWLFSDWLDLPPETTDVQAIAEVELAASQRDPYRRLSRVFHLLGRKR